MGVQEVAAALTKKPAAPFQWGAGGEALTPEQVATRQRMAQGLRQKQGYVPQGTWSLLGALAGEGVANYKESEADAATKAGHDKVAAALAEARKTGDYTGVMADEWATPGQQSVANALQSRGWQKEDQQATWAREDARAARAAAAAAAESAKPKYSFLDDGQGNTYRYNSNDPNSKPELFFDGPDKPGFRTMTVEEKAQYGLPADAPAQIGPDGKVDTIAQTAPPKDPNATNFDDISGIRKEIQALPSYKNYSQARPIYDAMLETAGRDSRASDLNLVYGLGKIMDPTSVVREGEMVMVKNTASLPDWLVGTINSLNGGAGLTKDTRKAILTEAFGRMKGYDEAFGKDAEMYKGIASRYKLNPDDILPQTGAISPWEPDAAAGAPAKPTSDAEYNALPSGALFIDPDDGQTYKKP